MGKGRRVTSWQSAWDTYSKTLSPDPKWMTLFSMFTFYLLYSLNYMFLVMKLLSRRKGEPLSSAYPFCLQIPSDRKNSLCITTNRLDIWNFCGVNWLFSSLSGSQKTKEEHHRSIPMKTNWSDVSLSPHSIQDMWPSLFRMLSCGVG
jgi:hypothetical protein